MTAPNFFLIYVTDVERATQFYRDLFDREPDMITPGYVSFVVAPGVNFSLWSGRADLVSQNPPRTSEVGLMVPGPASAVDDLYDEWVKKGVAVVDEPRDEVYGRTFVVADPDGNLIRVAPVD